MTYTLSQGPRPVDRETLPSFFARMAASKGVTAQNLAHDLGGSLRRVVAQDRDFLDRFAAWAGLSQANLDELLSWTGVRVGGVRMRFRSEIFISRALRNPVVHGCPECLSEDARSNPQEALAATAMQGHWQMREMVICVRHTALLVPLWNVAHPDDRHDFTQRLTEVLPAVLAGNMDGERAVPSGYDHWLEERLDTGRDETWLACHNLHAATTFCRLLGTELLRLQGAEVRDEAAIRHAAHAAGFNVIRHGPDAIRDALRLLAAAADGYQDEWRKAFGWLWRDFSQRDPEDNTFAPFIDLLRDTVLEIWPIPAGERLLGQVLPQRRLHSIRSAAKESGIDERRLRPLLVEAGVVAADDLRPDNRATFNARPYEVLLEILPLLVRDREMRLSIGATEAELLALEQDGILQPRTRLPSAKLRWLVADGRALIDELNELAVTKAEADKLETIQRAKANSGVSVGRIIAAIRGRKIRVYATPENQTYHGFQVCRSEFDSLE